ncbi:MAG: hypothetical protein HQM08_09550 [Candidatus Riflebacteria bacterium]|nr:hypothetical protein [Candidatus Riflebacteria bacterium]
MISFFGNSKEKETILKKYPNRRLYDPSKNSHVTLTEIADRVKMGEKIRIVDYQTGEDISQVIMGQVLFETLKTRPDYLPLDFLVLMIRAQDVMVRDFLQNGLPQFYQYYLELQKRFSGGMGWPQPNFLPGNLFGGLQINPFMRPPNEIPPMPGNPSPPAAGDNEEMLRELRDLKNEMEKLKTERHRTIPDHDEPVKDRKKILRRKKSV